MQKSLVFLIFLIYRVISDFDQQAITLIIFKNITAFNINLFILRTAIFSQIYLILYKVKSSDFQIRLIKNMNIHQNPKQHYPTKSYKTDSTDDETSENDLPFSKVTQTKYKTEMCKNFSEMGYCPYYQKCQFAHGRHELCLVPSKIKQSYRTRNCKPFSQNDTCRYGKRCQFSHKTNRNHTQQDPLKALLGVLSKTNQDKPFSKSRLLSNILQGE